MRHLSQKLIIQCGNYFTETFLELLRKSITNSHHHPLFPPLVTDVVKYFLRQDAHLSRHAIDKHLLSIIEIVLRQLDPNNPSLRKLCQ